MAAEYRPYPNKNVIGTNWVNGTTVPLNVSEHAQNANITTSGSSSSDDSYDSVGAMQFIIATVLVYSILGVFCTLLTRFKRERGSGHMGYVQDEMVLKYIKEEKFLKLSGYRMKLLYDSQIMAERIKIFDEKHKLLQLEKDLATDFSVQKTSGTGSQNNKKPGKRKHRIGSTVGKMGMSLFHVHSNTDSIPITNISNGVPVNDQSNRPVPEVDIQDDLTCATPLIEPEVRVCDTQDETIV